MAYAVCGNTFYHSGCLLLLNKLGVEISASTDPEKVKFLYDLPNSELFMHWHALVSSNF